MITIETEPIKIYREENIAIKLRIEIKKIPGNKSLKLLNILFK